MKPPLAVELVVSKVMKPLSTRNIGKLDKKANFPHLDHSFRKPTKS